jgi:hypothetical protein
MGREAEAKRLRRAQRAVRAQLEKAILAARRAGRDEVAAAADVMAHHAGRDAAACAEEIQTWLSPHLQPSVASPSPV